MAPDEELARDWRSRIQTDCPEHPPTVHESIVSWLLGEDVKRLHGLAPAQLSVAKQAMDYRYRILQQRYLGVSPEEAHRKLLQRLGSLFLIRSKVRTWVALSRDRHRTVIDVLQEVIQELIQNDNYIRQQMYWIAQCTTNPRLRNSLILASVEEYCLRPIRNQPLLVYRFVNYLRRSQRGGMTQVPTGELVRLVSEEITPDEADSPLSLLDAQAVTKYQEEQAWEEQQTLRNKVKQEFLDYLKTEVDPLAARWLELHLQGQSQEAIARTLDRPIKEIYRLREKISYHAIRVFTLKQEPELVMNWLNTSMEHNLGLTPIQWESFWQRLAPDQQRLLQLIKQSQTPAAIAQALNVKPNQITGEWTKIYLAAQAFRNEP
ncbi:MAG: HetZ-related protein 2 [Leptolyngbyaceae cyanobacterium SL_7_1]|nr:HetZ-related protein 2 [Leptolyngbyaceae cyanobacterium SL_7_1]